MDLRPQAPHLAVIGAGLAGVAAAWRLAGLGAHVTLYEAGRVAGGRSRRVGDGRLDNGQHILLGAYRETLALMRAVGVDPETALLRLPLALDVQDGMSLVLPAWPAPLHVLAGLARARGITGTDKLRLMLALMRLQRAGFRVPAGMTVAAWLSQTRQSPRLVTGFWQPLVLAALNTPLGVADMATLARVLRDSLASTRDASDLLLPRVELSALLPEPALLRLQQAGHAVRRAARVRTVRSMAGGVAVDGEAFAGVVVATAPYHAAGLLPQSGDWQALRQCINSLPVQPITTVYLQARPGVRLPRPMLGMAGSIAQWVLDRGQLAGHDGQLAVVISGPGEHQALAPDALGQRVAVELLACWPQLGPLVVEQVITEQRATFSCEAGLERPPAATPDSRIWLAGDYVAGEYPATIEGAIRSGTRAADALAASLTQTKRTI
ncbi:hydroxysqualene dehydroxylase HpnE [Laribacter hongkongensis]|uniref:hydroxysqualene dehydroxylase HpnE n=1 Tax=Laribacter hongkongensis TaxID=168471 RepID=UPI001EFD66C1|nr:hydroxysqualene dehydroxylase HpnE [Laribacter hongkongensis]